MTDVREVDIDSPGNDHLGDYVEGASPYPASQAAWRVVDELPDQTYADPQEVRDDMALFGAAPDRVGTPTKPLPAGQWAPNGIQLQDGAQSLQIANEDRQRTRLIVVNLSAGTVYVAPTDSRSVGYGSWVLPPGASVEIRCTAPVWAFTLADFLRGGALISLQYLAERYA